MPPVVARRRHGQAPGKALDRPRRRGMMMPRDPPREQPVPRPTPEPLVLRIAGAPAAGQATRDDKSKPKPKAHPVPAEVLSLDPAAEDKTESGFHGWRVLGRTAVKDAASGRLVAGSSLLTRRRTRPAGHERVPR